MAASAGPANSQSAGATALTIYSSASPQAVPPELQRAPARNAIPGYAVVRQEREIELARGRNDVRFSDVAALIDPTTVAFESLTDPKGTSVLEQNFQFDLVSTERLLTRYIDRAISVEQIRGQATESFAGTLLSTQGGIVLRRDDGGVQILPHNAGVKLPALPGGLITRPTLVWNVDAKSGGKQRTRVAYQTQGMSWWADYNVTFAEGRSHGECTLDLGAWVSIVNTSGASYADAKLKLVAGEVAGLACFSQWPKTRAMTRRTPLLALLLAPVVLVALALLWQFALRPLVGSLWYGASAVQWRLDSSDAKTREQALYQAVSLRPAEAALIAKITHMAGSDPAPSVRYTAVRTLGQLGASEPLPEAARQALITAALGAADAGMVEAAMTAGGTSAKKNRYPDEVARRAAQALAEKDSHHHWPATALGPLGAAQPLPADVFETLNAVFVRRDRVSLREPIAGAFAQMAAGRPLPAPTLDLLASALGSDRNETVRTHAIT